MPKIPTFESQGRPTAEVGGVKSNIQMPLETSLTKVGSAIANYYVREQEEEAKLKSIDYQNKALPKLYEVYDKYKNNPFPSEAADGFNREGSQVINNFINENLSNENKFVQRENVKNKFVKDSDKYYDLMKKNNTEVKFCLSGQPKSIISV